MGRSNRFELRADVALEPLTLERAPRMYTWMLDPWIRENIGLRIDPSLETTIAWIQRALEDASIAPFAVLLDGEHVGNVILDRMDRYLSSARLSIYIGERPARGAGIGRTATWLALEQGFHQLDLHKIWVTVHAENLAAMRTYVGLGFVLEGILRDEFLLRGRRLALFYMGLLRRDFDRQMD